MNFRFKCKRCGGLKFIGEEYYAFGIYYVDVTCVKCADSKDIAVSELNKLIDKLSKKKVKNAEQEHRSK